MVGFMHADSITRTSRSSINTLAQTGDRDEPICAPCVCLFHMKYKLYIYINCIDFRECCLLGIISRSVLLLVF